VPEFEFDLENLTATQLNAVMAGVVAIGTLYCFLGYRTLKFVIGLTGFLLAGCVAGALALWLSKGHEIGSLIAFAIGGICGAFALFFLYRMGVFLVGLLGAALIANNVLQNTGDAWVPLAVLGLGAVGGLVALILEKPVMLMATSVLGAWMLVSAGVFFIEGGENLEVIREALRSEEKRLLVLGAWLALSVVGIVSQILATRGAGAKKSES
jgi:hypothetical protein